MNARHSTSTSPRIEQGVRLYSGTYMDVANQGTDETVFMERVLPPLHWSGVGAHFRILAVIECPTAGPNRHVRVYCGDTVVYESGAFFSAEDSALMLIVDAWRAPANVLRIFSRVSGNSLTDYQLDNYTSLTVDFADSIRMSVRGQSQATRDLVYVVGHSEVSPPPGIMNV